MTTRRRTRLARNVIAAALVIVAALATATAPAVLATAVAPSDDPSDDQVASAAWVTGLPCFGAAARDPRQRCADERLRMTVFPSPDDAPLEPSAPCRLLGPADLLNPCAFGAEGAPASRSVALIGDSHASHWRAAVDVVARAQRWPAISLTFSGCPFNRARVIIPDGRSAACRRWNDEALGWLGRHPEISTIFVSARANARYVRTHRGRGNFETAVRGHLALWRALPASVRNIIVIRDTPVDSYAVQDCVRQAYAKGGSGIDRCARARSAGLHRDPAVTAARRLPARAHVLDMTRYFCDDARCYPVIGGALVHKDLDHITATYAKTLGPFMLPKLAGVAWLPR